MSRQFLTPVDLAQNELQNPVAQNLPSHPSTPAPKRGQFYINTGDNTLYWYDGSTWQSAKGGASTFPGYGSSTAQTAFGQAKSDGVSTTVTRSDHTHGTPTHDAAAHSAIPLSALSAPFGASTAVTTYGQAKADGVGTSAARNDHTHGSPAHTTAEHSAFSLSIFAAPTAALALGGQRITGLADGTGATDAATKGQLDSAVLGQDNKTSVRLASTGNLTLTGAATIDGSAVVTGDRILAKDQTTPAQNGIYIANTAGAWTRATDMDAWAEVPSAYVWVELGTVNADTGWLSTADPGGTLGTTAITWTQFAASGSAIAGAGMTKTGNALDVVAGDTSLTVAADNLIVNTGVIAARSYVDTQDALATPKTRTISTTAPLTGGGDLSANRTLAITSFAGSAAGAVPTSPGGTTSFLRADGSWASPAAGSQKIGFDVGGAVSQVLNHLFNSRDVAVQVYRNSSPWDSVECDVERTDVNNVTLRFAVAPASAAFRAVVTA